VRVSDRLIQIKCARLRVRRAARFPNMSPRLPAGFRCRLIGTRALRLGRRYSHRFSSGRRFQIATWGGGVAISEYAERGHPLVTCRSPRTMGSATCAPARRSPLANLDCWRRQCRRCANKSSTNGLAATLEQETAGGVVHVSEFIIRGDHRQVVELEFAHAAEATASFARRSPEAPHDGI
jgi:hypothetical protein